MYSLIHHTSQNLTDSCNTTRIPASNSTSYNEQHVASVAVTSIVTLVYLTLCVNDEPCTLDVSPGVVCTCRGVPRKDPLR